jgi:methionine-rich copper-binding protein CopC
LINRSHRREFRIAALVALALFIAQMGAIAHAYTHNPSTASTSAYQQIPNTHEFCSDCLNFAPLLAAAGTPAALSISLQVIQSAPPSAPPASFLDHRTYLAFRSRAPPVTR